MKLTNLAVAARMRLLIGMMLFGLIALCAVSLGSLRTTMMEDRKVQTKHQVESGASILKHFHALAQAGSLPRRTPKRPPPRPCAPSATTATTTCSSSPPPTTTSCFRPSPRWKGATPAA
jgi:hypothetical protein